MKTVKELHAEYEDFYDKHYAQMEAAIKREFPVGKRVAWMHGINKQIGNVERHAYGSTVLVKNERRGGGSKRVNAYELEVL